MKKMYKRDSTGSIRVWSIELNGEQYRTISGKLDGKMTVSKWTVCKGKNIGRANETLPDEQAEKEVNASYEKKFKEGYRYDIKEIDSIPNIFPMLADKYEDCLDKITFPVFSQPKLDGFRCNTKYKGSWNGQVEGLFSRENEQFVSCPHIESVTTSIVEKLGITLDGELYNHDLKDDFNELQSLITKKKCTAEDFARTEAVVQYHLYDIILLGVPFYDRFKYLQDLLAKYPTLNKYCKLVETTVCHTQEELDKLYEQYLEQGYEGQMVRDYHSAYERDSRPASLLKRKEFEDAEFPIVSIDEGIGNRSGMAGRVTCRLPDGRTFGAGITGGLKVNKQLFKDKDILPDQLATINFFGYTPDGIPRFPRFKAVRMIK